MILRWLVAQDLLFWLLITVGIAFLVPGGSYYAGLSLTESLVFFAIVIICHISLFFDVVRIRSDHEQ